MKLIQRTSYYFLSFSVITLLIGAFGVYAGLVMVFTNELDEGLLHTREVLKHELSQRSTLPAHLEIMDEIIELKKITSPIRADHFQDTLRTVFDKEEQEEELEPFRQYVYSENINGQLYQIKLNHSKFEKEDLLTALMALILGFLALFLLFLNLFNRFVSQQLWQPFFRLITQISNFDITKNKELEGVKSEIDEFATLSAATEKMTAKLTKDYQALKQFSENASHEIQTPLAIILAQTELLLQHQNLDEQQSVYIEQIQRTSQRLSKFNKSLLLLTKIGNRQFIELKAVSIQQVIEDKLLVLKPLLDAKDIAVEKHLSVRIVRANPDLVDVLISNLMGNAIKHNKSGGTISISLDQQHLIIQNDGLAPTYPTTAMFERFKKGDNSSSSLGLGLAIVKEICDAYQWNITYDFNNNRHKITLSF